MKKLFLSILVICSLLVGNAYAEKLNLSCSFISIYYQNSKDGELGITAKADEHSWGEFTANFTLNKDQSGVIGFQTNMPLIDFEGDLKIDETNGQYFFTEDHDKDTYETISLNRYDGTLVHSTLKKNDKGYVHSSKYSCETATQKF
tara:strand:+ start:432 stop:869 length:438 start_codon:yes stop_codon:yes gene_type:complete